MLLLITKYMLQVFRKKYWIIHQIYVVNKLQNSKINYLQKFLTNSYKSLVKFEAEKFFKDVISHQIYEGVCINNSPSTPGFLMNSRAEFEQGSVARVVVAHGLWTTNEQIKHKQIYEHQPILLLFTFFGGDPP